MIFNSSFGLRMHILIIRDNEVYQSAKMKLYWMNLSLPPKVTFVHFSKCWFWLPEFACFTANLYMQ